jgi:tetratricopeptide (TPR) repeat protein
MAAACFNRAWDYLEMRRRTGEEDLEMLNLSHSSLYHWQVAGTQRNIAISEWQLSRAYVAVGSPRLAILLAKSCLARCAANDLSDIIHSANEGLARAYAADGDYRKAQKHLSKARSQLRELKLPSEDRKVYGDQIAETASLIRSVSKRRTSST